MKRLVMTMAVLAAAGAFAAVKDFPWCKVDLPDSVTGGTKFQITVTPKKTLPDGCNLSIHMHHTKGNGQWAGLYEWRPSQNVKTPGQPLTFTFNAKTGSDCKDLCPMMFVAPGGDFGKKLKEFDVNLGKIAYSGGAGGAAAGGGAKSAQAQKTAASNYPAKPASVTFKKSFIWLEEAPKPTRAGENLTLRIHYKLDPSDTWGDKPTQMMCMPLGPWIDNPDGKYNTKRMPVGYPGLWVQHKSVEVGDHVIEFSFKLGKTFRYNGCSFLCKFKQPNGADWPWEWRGGGMTVIKESESSHCTQQKIKMKSMIEIKIIINVQM